MSSVSASYVFFPIFLCKVDYHYEADWVSEADVQTVIQSARSSGRVQAAPRASGFQALPSSFGVRNSPYTHLHRHLERIVPHSTKASATSCAPHVARGGSKRGEAYVSFFPSCVGPAEPYPVSFDVCGQLRRTLPRLSSFDTQQVSFPSLSTRIDAPRRATNVHGAAQHARASSRHAHHWSQHVDVQGWSGFHWVHLSLLHPITISNGKERLRVGTRTHPSPPIFVDRMDRRKRTHPSVPGAVRTRLGPLRHARWKGRSAPTRQGKRRTSLSDPRRISSGTTPGHPTDEGCDQECAFARRFVAVERRCRSRGIEARQWKVRAAIS